jgi:hypothetical protein
VALINVALINVALINVALINVALINVAPSGEGLAVMPRLGKETRGKETRVS